VDFILDIYLAIEMRKKEKKMKSKLGDYVIEKYLEWLKEKDR
jgi:hypothetical protein